MTIRYTNTFNEVLTFHINALVRSPVVLGIIAVIIALDAQEIWESLSEELSDSDLWVYVVAGSLTIAAMFAMIFAVLVLIAAAGTWMDKRSLAEHAITLTDSSLIVETPFRRTEYWWQGIVRLKRARGNLILYAAPSEAFIIPRRSFENDEQWDDFHEFCTKRIGSA